MSNTVTFIYPAGPNEVIVTGDFDLWRQSLPMVKQIDGTFSLTMPIPVKSLKDGNRLYFKYVVDGEWVTSSDYPKASSTEDASIVNNYIEIDEESKRSSSFIPESVLPMSASSNNLNKQNKRKMKIKRKVRKNKKTGEKTILSEETEVYDGNNGSDSSAIITEQEVSTNENTPFEKTQPTTKTTTEALGKTDDAVVDETLQNDTFAEAAKAKASLPAEPVFTVQPIVPETEQSKPLAGETGPVIPKDADNIKEFNEVRDVDQEELNARLNKELKDKEELSGKTNIKSEQVDAPAAVGKMTSLAGEPGPVIPENPSEIKEFSEIRDEDKHPQPTETKYASLAGEPGPVIPENPSEIKEFSEIRKEAETAKTETAPNEENQEFHIQPIVPEVEKVQPLVGEPGPVIPQNAEDIKEFNEVRDVDQEELNTKLNKELKDKEAVVETPKEAETAKTETALNEENQEFHIQPIVPEVEKVQPLVGEPGPVIPQNAEDIKEFNEVRDVDQEELNTKLNKELKDKEAVVETPKKAETPKDTEPTVTATKKTEPITTAAKKTKTAKTTPKPAAVKPTPKSKVTAKKPIPATAQKKEKSECCVIC